MHPFQLIGDFKATITHPTFQICVQFSRRQSRITANTLATQKQHKLHSRRQSRITANSTTVPVAIIHRLPRYNLPSTWAKDVFNPVEPSDPLYPIHRPTARIIIVMGPSPLKSEMLDRYPAVECVIGTTAGVDHIDLAECRRRNIRVTNAGMALAEDGADYAIGLLLDVLRRVSAADRFVRAGLWPIKGEHRLGNKLGGKRIGIVGLGNIGTLVAKRLESFGCTIAYFARTKKSQFSYAFYPSVLDLATNSDSLIVCCTLSDKTHHIINRDVMTALGKKGVIVNIGRGALIDEKELVKFLVGGDLGGAGLDVFENEPEVPEEFFKLDNIVLSPHKAVRTSNSFDNVREVVIGNVRAFFSNKPLLSEINLYD